MARLTLRATKELDYTVTVDVPDDQVNDYLEPSSDAFIGEMMEGLTPVCETWVDARAEMSDDTSSSIVIEPDNQSAKCGSLSGESE